MSNLSKLLRLRLTITDCLNRLNAYSMMSRRGNNFEKPWDLVMEGMLIRWLIENDLVSLLSRADSV